MSCSEDKLSIYTKSDSTLMLNVADRFDIISVERRFYTLIPSRFPPIDLYERIAGLRSSAVAEIEALTNPRLKERSRVLNGVDASGLTSSHLQNWNHAPFTYLNPDGSRFFDATVPALELSDSLQTALAVSVKRREQFLAQTSEGPVNLDMRALSRIVKGRFIDLSNEAMDLNRDECLALGQAVLETDADGLLFRCFDRPSAKCIAIIRGETLEKAVQGDHFRFVWDGNSIKTLYAFSNGMALRSDHLKGAETVLAA